MMDDGNDSRHCDDYIRDKAQPRCLRLFLLINRVPAVWKYDKWLGCGRKEPELYATVACPTKDDKRHVENAGIKDGQRVRVVMASRFGDVGISPNMDKPHGYATRVYLECLKDFSDTVASEPVLAAERASVKGEENG